MYFYGKHLGDPNPMFALDTAQDSCGLTLERVEQRSPKSLTALLRERCLPGRQRAKLGLGADGKLKAVDL
ncbi:MAG TPA: hypothetical protein VIH12_07145, partial [Solibacillus sp.]